MKSKKLFLLVASCAAVAAVAGVTFHQAASQNSSIAQASETTYHLHLDANNNVFGADISSRAGKSVFTDLNNKLSTVVNALSMKDGYWGSFADGGYFYLDTVVHGLKKVTIVFEGDGTLGIHGGADSVQLACKYPSLTLTHFENVTSGAAYDFENGMNTFEIKATGTVDIKSIDVEYSCADTSKANEYGVIENSNGHVRLNSTTASKGMSYLGLSDIGVGNKVQFTFKGKNIPNVLAFADTDNGGITGTDKSEGVYIMTANVESKTDANWTRMMPYGPYRLDTVTDKLGGNTYRQSSYSLSNAGCGSLNDEHDYKYVIALNPFTDTTTCHITVSLTDVTANTTISKEVTFDTKVGDVDEEIYNNTKFIIYGQSDEIEFDYEVVTGLTAKESYRATFDSATNTASLEMGTGSTNYTDLSYLDFGAYETGAFVGMEFTGKYKPQVAFFADGGHKAFKSDASCCLVWTDDYVGSDYRINKKTDCSTNVFAKKSEMQKAAYNNLTESGKYYLAIATRIVDSKYQFDYNFYTVSGTTLTLQGTWSDKRNLTEIETSGTHIVVYGSRIKAVTAKLAFADTLDGVLQGYTVAESE